MKKSRCRFDAEFKRQAVRLVLEDGKSTRAVERDLGIGEGMVYRWVREAKASPHDAFPGNGNVRPSIADVGKLVRENEQLRRQREISRKALAIFSQTSTPSTPSSASMRLS